MESKHGYKLAPELVHEAIRAHHGNVYDFCDAFPEIELGVLITHIENGLCIEDIKLIGAICAALKTLPSELSWQNEVGGGVTEWRTSIEKTIRRLGYERDAEKINSLQHANAVSKLLVYLTPKYQTEAYLIAVDNRRIERSYPSLESKKGSFHKMIKEQKDGNAVAPEDAESARTHRRDE